MIRQIKKLFKWLIDEDVVIVTPSGNHRVCIKPRIVTKKDLLIY
jgi:hypothetical protein